MRMLLSFVPILFAIPVGLWLGFRGLHWWPVIPILLPICVLCELIKWRRTK